MKRKQADLTGAEAIYAVSNVPLFLLRKLKADAAPREISSLLSAAEILDELRTSVRIKPQTLRQAAEPYVLLVALSQKRDLAALKEATAINAPYHDWFAYLSSVVEQTFTPSTMTSLIMPGEIRAALPTNTSTASTRRLILTC
jgi:hypothetical protein